MYYSIHTHNGDHVETVWSEDLVEAIDRAKLYCGYYQICGDYTFIGYAVDSSKFAYLVSSAKLHTT